MARKQGPDFPTLQAVGSEMNAHQRAGTWSREAFMALWPRAKKAANGTHGALGFLFSQADPAWLEELNR